MRLVKENILIKSKKINKKKERFNCNVTFCMSGVVNNDVTPEDLIKNGTEFLAEPKNADGCIVAMRIQSIDIMPKPSRVETNGLKED